MEWACKASFWQQHCGAVPHDSPAPRKEPGAVPTHTICDGAGHAAGRQAGRALRDEVPPGRPQREAGGCGAELCVLLPGREWRGHAAHQLDLWQPRHALQEEEGFVWSSKCCRLLGSFADCKQQPGHSLLQLSYVSSCGRHTAGQQAADRSDVTALAAKVGCRPLTRCMTLSVSTQQLFELKQAEGTFQ